MERTRSATRHGKNRTPLSVRLKRYFFFGVALIVLGFGSLSVLGKNGILEMMELQNLHRSLEVENGSLLDQQEKLQAEITRLNDPQYLEFIARERFGFMKPNEVFLVLETSQTNSPVDN